MFSSSQRNILLQSTSKLIPMKKAFEGEQGQVNYLHTTEERAPYKHKMVDGKLFNTHGVVSNKKILYVLDENDILYGVPEEQKWNHSFFLAGKPVKAAGFIETDVHGFVISISNESGHYTPTFSEMCPALEFFYSRLSNSKIIDMIEYHSHDEAQTKKLVTVYGLDTLMLNLQSNCEFDLNDCIQYSYPVNQQSDDLDQEENVDGYEEKLSETKKIVTHISRFGLNPKKAKPVNSKQFDESQVERKGTLSN